MPKKKSNLTAKKRSKTTTESPWVQHLRACMKKRNLTYRQAVTDTECRKEYYKKQLKEKLAALK